MKIAIILGGASSEKDISIMTGLSVSEALSSAHDVELIHIFDDISFLPEKLLGFDIIFNALHGGTGENGDMQSFFDLYSILYCGSDARSSKVAMDKHLSKIIAKNQSILTPEWLLLKNNKFSLNSFNSSNVRFGYPIIVKPSDEGSTFGLSLVSDESELHTAIDHAFQFSKTIMVEEYIPGREFTVGILGSKPLPLVEIIPNNDLYDYECKYTDGKCEYSVPADLSEKLVRNMQKDALKIYNTIGCRHYGRVDFRLNENDEYYFLEINTLPGMTSTSLLPKAAKAAGLTFPDLVNTLIKIAMVDQ